MGARETEDDVFGRAADELDHLQSFVALAESALHMAAQSTRVLELLEKHRRVVHESTGARDAALRAAKSREEYAARQLELGNPYLYGLAAIRLWSILESFIEGLLHLVLARPEVRRNSEVIMGLKGSVVEFAGLSNTQQVTWIVGALQDSLRPMKKRGVGQFECLLEAIGCEGGVPDAVRRALLELQQVRHVLVHRSGRADQRLVNICPWINRPLGADVALTSSHLRYYHCAAAWYLLDVSRRILPLRFETVREDVVEVESDSAITLAALLADLQAWETPWTGRDGDPEPGG